MKKKKGKAKVVDIARAEKKLRQAEYFLWALEQAPQEIALQRVRGVPEQTEPLEYHFSACLSAAQSVFYILGEIAGPKFKEIKHDWAGNLPNGATRARFNQMVKVRDDDVHYGEAGATPRPKHIAEDPHSGIVYQHISRFDNGALFGPTPVPEETNPDGVTVRGHMLRPTVGLYLDLGGSRVEATTACRDFIEQLRALLNATKI